VCSADDWKFAAEQFVRRRPDKVIVHRKYPPPPNGQDLLFHVGLLDLLAEMCSNMFGAYDGILV
jgi:hypothetical protein